MTRLKLLAPAKLNLFLHITGRLTNGYHALQSIFVMVDLCDTVCLTARADSNVTRSGDVVGDVTRDLCVRAAKVLQQATGCDKGVDIHVEKSIPAGAGMGGGSSDAATTLLGLNSLWSLGLSQEELMHLGLKLGADVPFFILGKNAWVEGVGEILTPIDVPQATFDVIWPGVTQGTPEIFSHPDLTRDTKPVKIPNFDGYLTEEVLRNLGHNDLERVVKMVNPEVSSMLERFKKFRLTGSGSAAFALTDENDARGQFETIPKNWQHFLVKSLKINPTLSALPC